MIADFQRRIIDDIKGKNAMVVGLGVTSVHLIRFLASIGVCVTVCDVKNPVQLGERIEEIGDLKVDYRFGDCYLDDLDSADLIFLSPGVNPSNAKIQRARANGVRITSEIELLFELCNAPIIGITGSSGKTTTTTLTGQIMDFECKARGRGGKTYVGGNIGTPLIEKVLDFSPEDVVVLELSSFQLKYMKKSPHVGAILNITPNHLDVHPDMADYISAKQNVIRYQSGDDFAVLNIDNQTTNEMIDTVESNVMPFSRLSELDKGVFLSGEDLILRRDRDSSAEVICKRSDIQLPGDHNVENVLAAIAICSCANARGSMMAEVIRDFKGVPHRLETVGIVNKVKYINDSISTTPSRAMAGILAMTSPIIQIAGGYDKKLPFDEMAELAVDKVKAFVLLGATADKIQLALEKAAREKKVSMPTVLRASDLEEAVRIASDIASEGDVVLLSPACASYDMFKNFDERGRAFKDKVKAMMIDQEKVNF